MRWSGRSTVGLPVIFWTKLCPGERLAAQPHELVGVRRVAAGRGGEDERFGEPAVALFMLHNVLAQLRDDAALDSGAVTLPLQLGGVETALVLQQVELLRPVSGSMRPTARPRAGTRR